MTDHSWTGAVMGVTVSFVRGLDLEAAGDVLRLQWPTERRATFGEAEGQWEWNDVARFPVMVDERDGWLVLVEPNGWGAVQQGIARALSRGGVAVSVYWNVNAVMLFSLARDGLVVRSFDPLSPRHGHGQYGDPLPEEAGLVVGDPDRDPRHSALDLAERLTGVPVDGAWLLERPWRTWTTDGATWVPGGDA